MFVAVMTAFRKPREETSLLKSAAFRKSLTGRALLWMTDTESSDAAGVDFESSDPDSEWNSWEMYMDGSNASNGTSNSTKCNRPLRHHIGYNDSCEYVQDKCQDIPTLIDYLSLAACNLGKAKVGHETIYILGHV